MRLRVIEGFNGYYLVDTMTGREAAMGDGVDQPYGEVGTPLFRERWEDDVNSAAEEVLEAYFPNVARRL